MEKKRNPLVIGASTIHIACCSQSSMDWAKEHCETAVDGTVFLADRYMVARGRQKRIWQLQPGQLILTLLLKPECTHIKNGELVLNHLSMALTVGVVEALQAYNVKIKWPNDFIIGTKKMGGILIEVVWQEGEIRGIVVGIALNINNIFVPSDELFALATSIKAETNKTVSVELLQKSILFSLDGWYLRWKNEEYDVIFQQWRQRQAFLQKHICVHHHDGSIVCGIVKDVCDNGDLLLVGSDKTIHKISFCVVESMQI